MKLNKLEGFPKEKEEKGISKDKIIDNDGNVLGELKTPCEYVKAKAWNSALKEIGSMEIGLDVEKVEEILDSLGIHWSKRYIDSNYKSPCCNTEIVYGQADSYPFEHGSSCKKCDRVLTLDEKREYKESKEEILYQKELATALSKADVFKIGED